MPRRSGKKPYVADSPSRTKEGLSVSDPGCEEFLAALEQIDPDAAVEESEEHLRQKATPRRLKQLERGRVKPVETLDLHGLSREDALNRTRAFVGHAARQGWAAVLIVTGQGLHSQNGPVLRQAVEHLLANSPQLVLEWGRAPRQYGGSGALAVFLRCPPE